MVDEQQRRDDCKTEYDVCMNEVERHQTYHQIWVWAIIIAITAACLWIAPVLFPDDEYVLSRALILRIPVDLINAGILMSALVLLDVITPGGSIKTATSEPLPSAILLGSFLLALSIIMMSS